MPTTGPAVRSESVKSENFSETEPVATLSTERR